MDLIINNKIIYTPIIDILQELKRESGGNYLSVIEDKGDYVRVTCPFHKDGQERHPSCSVYSSRDSKDIPPGTVHCFTCNAKMSLVGLVSYILGVSEEYAKDWLTDNFSDTFIDVIDTSVFDFEEPETVTYLDESVLNKYNYYHPYMEQRKLTREVIQTFKIGYDQDTQSITFPVWDEHNRLVMITKRSVNSKKFFIPGNKNKPVYLLYDLKERNCNSAIVCESQINTLTLRTWNYDSIGLFGTGSDYQYTILRRSGIRTYFLALDGDEAGTKGIFRFIKKMPDDIIINIICIPSGKDVNDLTKEEFESLEVIDKFEWLSRVNKKNK